MQSKLRLLIVVLLIVRGQQTFAGSATWNSSPTNSDWNTAANWTPATVPNGPDDIATFATSARKTISLSEDTEVNEIVFSRGADALIFRVPALLFMTISGAGIANDSGMAQRFVAEQDGSGYTDGGSLLFVNNASAGTNTSFTVKGGRTEDFGVGGSLSFSDSSSADHAFIEIFGAAEEAFRAGSASFGDSSTAANATIVVHHGGQYPGTLSFGSDATAGQAEITNAGGFIAFYSSATAGDSTITNTDFGSLRFDEGSSAGHAIINNAGDNFGHNQHESRGHAYFQYDCTADNATITNYGGVGAGAFGGYTSFYGGARAGNATIIAYGGTEGGAGGLIDFGIGTIGATARMEVFGNGTLDVTDSNLLSATIGSLEGDGAVLLGSTALTTGNNNLSTTFSGVIQDSGSLTKVGSGNLTLTGANTYTGGTILLEGILLANNTSGSATGGGSVQIKAGTFGGGGTVTGLVKIGTGRGPGSILGPGATGVIPGTLAIKNKLQLMADATYRVTLDSSVPSADRVIAKGVSIRGAQIVFDDRDNTVLSAGTAFTVVDNIAANPIAGTFGNLADGSTITIGNNTFQANYEGGDGNDLTLTVQ